MTISFSFFPYSLSKMCGPGKQLHTELTFLNRIKFA
jgi:hypothetical protein